MNFCLKVNLLDEQSSIKVPQANSIGVRSNHKVICRVDNDTNNISFLMYILVEECLDMRTCLHAYFSQVTVAEPCNSEVSTRRNGHFANKSLFETYVLDEILFSSLELSI